MDNEKAVLVGIDLTDEFTQLSYVNEHGELYSACLSKDPGKYRIPTMLCAFPDSSDWLFGDDAAALTPGPASMKVTGLVTLASENGSMDIFGQNYAADMTLFPMTCL